MSGISWHLPSKLWAMFFSSLVLAFLFTISAGVVRAQALYENFDVVSDNDPSPMPGWVALNHSGSVGGNMWFQGNPDVFYSLNGAPESYIGANFEATTGTNTISVWLLTPQRTFNNGDVVRFATQTVAGSIYPDRLQVRLSTSGASTNVGTGPEGVGDFSQLLLDINPTLAMGGYPEYWQFFQVTITGLSGATSGRVALRYYVTNGGPTGDNSNYIGVDAFSITHPAAHQESDYDGDGITDPAVVRNTGGGQSGQVTWLNTHSSSTFGESDFIPWGIATDFAEPGDYDGDNKTDIAVWREGAPDIAAYHIFRSSNATYMRVPIGQTGDNPDVHGDYDGDGKVDPAVFGTRTASGNSTFFWFVGSLNNPTMAVSYRQWGVQGDFPAPGDYDGDGTTDLAIQRDGGNGYAIFWIGKSSGGLDVFPWGTPTDVVAPGDYDGDGKTDVVTVKPTGGDLWWYVRTSSNPPSYNPYAPTAVFGHSATDFFCQGDYDGDGRTDIAVWRPDVDPTLTNFYWLGSSSGFTSYNWGEAGDVPTAAWNSH